MKSNDPHKWTILLCSEPHFHRGSKHQDSIEFTGTIDDAFQAADERESAVDFDVWQVVITRRPQA